MGLAVKKCWQSLNEENLKEMDQSPCSSLQRIILNQMLYCCFSFGIAVPGVAVPVGSLTNLTLLTILWVLLPPYLQNGNMRVRVKQKKY